MMPMHERLWIEDVDCQSSMGNSWTWTFDPRERSWASIPCQQKITIAEGERGRMGNTIHKKRQTVLQTGLLLRQTSPHVPKCPSLSLYLNACSEPREKSRKTRTSPHVPSLSLYLNACRRIREKREKENGALVHWLRSGWLSCTVAGPRGNVELCLRYRNAFAGTVRLDPFFLALDVSFVCVCVLQRTVYCIIRVKLRIS